MTDLERYQVIDGKFSGLSIIDNETNMQIINDVPRQKDLDLVCELLNHMHELEAMETRLKAQITDYEKNATKLQELAETGVKDPRIYTDRAEENEVQAALLKWVLTGEIAEGTGA